jgi:hypothetical protein
VICSTTVHSRRKVGAMFGAALGATVLIAGCTSGSNNTAGSANTAAAATPVAAAPVAPKEFGVLHPAVGLGLLRVMTLEERPNQRDIVIYPALPNELSRVAGVITTVAQTPLSHVNLRAVQDNVPNAFVPGALDDPGIKALIGRYVKYTVAEGSVTIAAATQAEVEAHHAASRPAEAQTPERDLSVRAITPLANLGFDDWRAFGVKAANVATLATFDLADADVPDGYAIPFSFYDEFMKANSFYDRVAKLLADAKFRSDPAVQDEQLAELRDAIKAAPMPAGMEAELDVVQRSFPVGASIRCRSSTNNEDLPNFSGAGLYDSKTQHGDEGHLSKCVKQVFASVWNLRAFLERDFYRIDHLATAMGVLLHPAFADEQANGVAVSIDPVYDTPGAFYVNAQRGEDLVTNPDALSVPEALLLGSDGSVAVITYSNRVEPGEKLLTDAQISALRSSLTVVHDRFKALYKPANGEKFAMEVEFKITSSGRFSIKQARTWVFA